MTLMPLYYLLISFTCAVRLITRLDETCKEMRNAARIIGDSGMYQKMEEASRMIKRDIVFASSLYIS